MTEAAATTVTFLGSADMVPDVDRDTASFLINGRWLVDCGWCAALGMRRWGFDPLNLDALFLTHCHHDHVMGLPALLFYRGMWQPSGVVRPPLRIFGPSEEMPEAVLNARRFLRADRFPEEWAEPQINPLSPGDRYEEKAFELRVARTQHFVPGLAWRFVDRATGAVVCFTGDTGFKPDLVPLAEGADLLIHDATNPGATPSAPGDGHSSAAEAAEIARRAGVKRLALIHYRLADAEVSLAAARAVFPKTVLAREGETIRMEMEL